MSYLDLYYRLKPIIPRRLGIYFRRLLSIKRMSESKGIWPIDPQVDGHPNDWPGWPDEKRFALVLQHDVDTKIGLEKCRSLMDLEKSMGFRSAFFFVPKGYHIPVEFRRGLREDGFEIGVHGLRHDGRLFESRKRFERDAPEIKDFLELWNARGFSSPSTRERLDWIGELGIEYDCSTFDVDPFEPEPRGVKRIFPFFVRSEHVSGGYVELPYTLPQDHTLFVILQERNIRIWTEKLEWIAERGGMALLNTHPDYMDFQGGRYSHRSYPACHYRDFLEHLRTRYEGQFWHALPGEVAEFWRALPRETESHD